MIWPVRRRRRKPAEEGPTSPRRLLIVSDMHLGRDPRPITGFSHSHRPTPEFDENFVALVDHYTGGSEPTWRLVLGGDCIDFVEVVVRPEAETPLRLSFEVTKEEKALGLGSEAERAKVKLEMTVEYHRALFARLARFVRAGGELLMIRGNHDAEMFWGKVQRFLRQRLAELAFEGEKFSVDEMLERRAEFQSRIHFVPWCYVEPGRVYLEHGHQYDPYCSFDHQLYPVSPTDPRQIDTPLFMFAMRYFVNRLSDFASHYADFWTVKDYLRWFRQRGFSGVFYTLYMAGEAATRSVHYAALFWLGRVGAYENEHARRLEEEAARYDVPVESLRRIDELHYTPVTRNLPELMRLLFLDRLLLGLGAGLTLLFWLLIFDNPWMELLGVGTVLLAAFAANRRLEPRRFLLPGPRQAYAAREIADLLGVRVVAMGHSHQRRKVDLGEGRFYVNTGCWLPPVRGEPHAPDDTCTCNLSHLVIDERHADLRIFCRVHRKPRTDLPPTSPRVLHPAPPVMDLPTPEEADAARLERTAPPPVGASLACGEGI